MSQEKRQEKRVPVCMKIDATDGLLIGFGYAQNISVKGLGVDAQAIVNKTKVKIGDCLRMKFMIPESQMTITTSARIVRVEENANSSVYLAFEFVDLLPDHLVEIERYVNKTHKSPHTIPMDRS